MWKEIKNLIPLVFLGILIVATALFLNAQQDRANPRPTKTAVRPALVLTPSSTPIPKPQALCTVPGGPEPLGTPRAYLERPMKGYLTAEYLCREFDGTMVTRTITFVMFYDARVTLDEIELVKLTSLCPELLPNSRFELWWGSCRVSGGAIKLFPATPTPTPKLP